MLYHRIDINYDLVKNGVYSVEMKNKHSFKTVNDKKLWNYYFDKNRKDRSRVELENYTPLKESFETPPVFFPVGKKVKPLDFMAYCPFEHGVQFLISEQVYHILQTNYKLPIHNKITIEIDTFDQKYYLIGFPVIPPKYYDFGKSTFFDYKNGSEFKFKDLQDYENADYEKITAPIQKLYLNKNFDYDIINTTKGVFISPDLLKHLDFENITGYVIGKGVLEN